MNPTLAALVGGIAAAVALGVAAPGAAAAAQAVPTAFPAAGELEVATVVARAAPSPKARPVLVLRQFRRDFRPQVFLSTASRTGADGRPWLRLNLPMRPNGTTGWIPAAAADAHPIDVRIRVSRAARTLSLYRRNRLLYRTTVAVGAPGMETPVGNFYITARFVPDNGFLGVFAFETSAYSKLTDWPGGGVVGIHGTSMPSLLGQAVSHGCVRMSNTAALVLKRYVRLGTPVSITA
jgi:lipoprotein-anchoring transpeptidase ErfK/SrfK